MWSIPKLQRDFAINYKWDSTPVLDTCTVFQDVIIFLIMLTPYLECRWVSFSVSEYVAKCTILSPVDLYDSIQFGRSRRLGGIIIPRHNYATTAASFFVRGAILWNDLPMSVREERDVGKFREKCRSFMEQTANNLYFCW
jgi:hypothetical protein